MSKFIAGTPGDTHRGAPGQAAANAQRCIRLFAALAIVLLGNLAQQATPAQAVSPDIVISQVYGGGGNSGAPYSHDFVELFNRGASAVSLNGWSLQYASATGTGNFGASSSQLTELPDVTIQPGQYFLVQQGAGTGSADPLPTPDFADPTPINMSGMDGKVALVDTTGSLGCNGGSNPCSADQLAHIIDLVGYGNANFFETEAAPRLGNTTSAQRAANGCTDTDDNSSDFAEGAPAPRNTSSPLQPCDAPTGPTGTASPALGLPGESTRLALNVTPGTNPASTDLAVSVDLSAIGGSATQAFYDDGSNGDVTAGDNVFSYLAPIPPGTTPGDLSLPATITDGESRSGSAALALTIADPATRVRIREIQGAAHTSPLVGQVVTTQGIVTVQASNGFYLQDPDPDDLNATSEAIFVFTSAAPSVVVGEGVLVQGTVTEFRPGGLDSTNLTITELTSPLVGVQSSGNALPAPVVLGNNGRIPPMRVIDDDATGSVETSGSFDADLDGIDFFESLEAMRVQVNDPLAIGPTNAFGEIAVVGDAGANASLLTVRNGLVIQSDDFNPERIILDDVLIGTPNVKTGAMLGTVIGVLDYSFGNFKLFPTEPVEVRTNDLAQESAADAPPHQLAVATFNVENLNPGSPQQKFDDLADAIVHSLKAPDLIAVEEIQDNNGATNDGTVDADQTFTALIAAIQAAGGPTYDFRQINPANNEDGGQPGGNIRVGFLFRTDRGLAFVDRSNGDAETTVAVAPTDNGVELSISPGRIDPTHAAFADSRKPLAGEFTFQGETLFVIASHFNSKGGDEPLFGHLQPPDRVTEIQRHQQAQVVNDFVDSLLAADPNANIVVLGDFNDFQFSETMNILTGGSEPVLFNLLGDLPTDEQYTYIFDGNSQALDHTLVSAAIYNRPLVYDVVHINSEFPVNDRTSDHDPQVSFLCIDSMPPSISVSATPTTLHPPNHKLVPVQTLVSVADNSGIQPEVKLLSATSNEPDNGLGDGDVGDDIVIVDDQSFQLRAERSGAGSGRVYTLTYEATDNCGNSATASATVTVPHDQGNGNGNGNGNGRRNNARESTDATDSADAAATLPDESTFEHHVFLPMIRQ